MGALLGALGLGDAAAGTAAGAGAAGIAGTAAPAAQGMSGLNTLLALHTARQQAQQNPFSIFDPNSPFGTTIRGIQQVPGGQLPQQGRSK